MIYSRKYNMGKVTTPKEDVKPVPKQVKQVKPEATVKKEVKSTKK